MAKGSNERDVSTHARKLPTERKKKQLQNYKSVRMSSMTGTVYKS